MSGTADPSLQGPCDTPAALLEAAFLRIERERMAGIPVLNAALRVEAVGFHDWNGHWLGVLITPWFMNLMLLPGRNPEWTSLNPGDCRVWRFPSGEYPFIGGWAEEVGEYHACSLFSPVFEFADQETARSTAQAALDALLEPMSPRQQSTQGPVAARAGKLEQPMSKRDFLTGAFLRGKMP